MDELKIPISTPFNGQGADQAKKAIDGLRVSTDAATKAAQSNTKEAKTLGTEILNLGNRQNEAKDVIEGVTAAAQGNAGAFFGLAKAAKNLWEIFSGSTAIGKIVQLSALAATALFAFRDRIFGAGEAAKEAEGKFDHLTTAFDKIKASKADAFKAELAEIQADAKAAGDELDRILKLQAAIAAAKQGAASATIAGDPGTTATEKAIEQNKVDNEAVAAARQREDVKLGGDADAATQVKERTAAVAARRESERAQLEENIKRAQSAGPDAKTRIRELEAEMAVLQKKPGGTSPEAMARGDRMAQIVKDIEAEKKNAQAAESPANVEFIKQQQGLLKTLETAAKEAQKAADEAEIKWRTLEQTIVNRRPDGSAVPEPAVAIARGLEDKEREIKQRERVRDGLVTDIANKRDIPMPAAIEANQYFSPRASRANSPATIIEPTLDAKETIARNRELAARATSGGSGGDDGRRLWEEAKANAEKQAQVFSQAIKESNGVLGNAVITAIQNSNAKIIQRLDTLENQVKNAPRGN